MDCYLTLPFSELKLQELVAEAKDFVYALGKENEEMVFDRMRIMTISHSYVVYVHFLCSGFTVVSLDFPLQFYYGTLWYRADHDIFILSFVRLLFFLA